MDLDGASRALRPDAATALEAWRALVDADREQVERLSQRELGGDYYAPMASNFRPDHRPSLELPVLETFARPDDAWRDIGAGGGRLAVGLAKLVRRVVAVEPSESMRGAMAAGIAEAGVTNVEVLPERWPPEDLANAEVVDVSMGAHATYDIADIGAWIEAMEATSRRLCVIALGDRARGGYWTEVWQAAHGEPMAVLPGLREFVTLLEALDRAVEVRLVPAAQGGEPVTEEQAFATARRFCWLQPDTPEDERMQAFMRERYAVGDGMMRPPPLRRHVGIVSWTPPTS
ncbi:MAG: class I SAM-dependent methyltransferase [Dehalococcoidia bacterium]